MLDRNAWGADRAGEDHAEHLAIGEREVEFLRTGLDETFTRSGWPVLSEAELNGALGDNAPRFYRLG